MSEAPSPADRTAALLDRLIDLDMAAAEHVHAQLLAATEPAEVASLSRAYNRCSRGARQSVMLRMRWEKARAEAEARAARPAPKKYQPSPYDRMADIRIADLQDAVGRVAAAAHPDNPRRQREALDRLDYEIDIWNDDEDDALIVERLDDLVLQACERAGLPLDLARRWEDLPPAPQTFDPAENPPVPKADTG